MTGIFDDPEVEPEPDDLDEYQQQAFTGVANFVTNDNGQSSVYALHGLAGTGKTYTLARLAKHFGYRVCAPTGKAAAVLRQKHGIHANTIHQTFFALAASTKKEDERPLRYRTTSAGTAHDVFSRPLNEDEEDLHFVVNDAPVKRSCILLDEASMVGETMAKNLLGIGVRIIAVGDPGQLPPVEDQPYFNRPNFTLPKIHRQARDSPVIRQAHNIRHGMAYAPDGVNFQVVEKLTREHVREAGAVICWRRATRDQVTDILRGQRGLRDKCPQPGEPVICLKNCYGHNIFNGMIGHLLEPFEPGNHVIHLSLEGETKIIPHVKFQGMPVPNIFGFREQTAFDFGYALTAHKAQGSEWPTVIVIDEMPVNHPDYACWTYTAITRAQQKCIILPRR